MIGDFFPQHALPEASQNVSGATIMVAPLCVSIKFADLWPMPRQRNFGHFLSDYFMRTILACAVKPLASILYR